jgi:predicted lipid-binding transport protein (Tim44 family)
MGHADIIIYGLIAVVLLARLWVVFGRRNEEDTQRPNPFATPAPGRRDDEDVVLAPERKRGDEPSAPAFTPLLSAPMSLAGTLERIKQQDAAFDEKQFLQQARSIFTSVLEAFAKGDLAPVKNKLGPAVAASFAAAIDKRRKAGETLENRIIRIRDVETAVARLDDDNKAVITVRFISEQENIIRNASSHIVSGGPGQVEEVTDLWIFTRELKSTDWQLAETRS